MENIISAALRAARKIAAAGARKPDFCNIAEGTHAGHMTAFAKSALPQSNLLVKAVEGGVALAGADERPVGVCTDCGEAGDPVDVALPGCAESTVICVAIGAVETGDALYSAAAGKVSASMSPGCHKVGVALTPAPSGGVVEVDPQGFGMKAYEILACGSHTWNGGAATTDTMALGGIKSGDAVFAVIAEAGGSATSVKGQINEDATAVTFTLNQNGANGSTVINWMVVRNA